MTIAIIKTGGKQYKVAVNQELKIEKIIGEPQTAVEFPEVLMVADEEGTTLEIGTPFIVDKAVKAEIIEQGRARKVDVVKFKNKTRYRRKAGHRQPYTKVKITQI